MKLHIMLQIPLQPIQSRMGGYQDCYWICDSSWFFNIEILMSQWTNRAAIGIYVTSIHSYIQQLEFNDKAAFVRVISLTPNRSNFTLWSAVMADIQQWWLANCLKAWAHSSKFNSSCGNSKLNWSCESSWVTSATYEKRTDTIFYKSTALQCVWLLSRLSLAEARNFNTEGIRLPNNPTVSASWSQGKTFYWYKKKSEVTNSGNSFGLRHF